MIRSRILLKIISSVILFFKSKVMFLSKHNLTGLRIVQNKSHRKCAKVGEWLLEKEQER
jgi:hypothetical protein